MIRHVVSDAEARRKPCWCFCLALMSSVVTGIDGHGPWLAPQPYSPLLSHRSCTAMQSQKAVTAYLNFSSKQVLPFGFALQCGVKQQGLISNNIIIKFLIIIK